MNKQLVARCGYCWSLFPEISWNYMETMTILVPSESPPLGERLCVLSSCAWRQRGLLKHKQIGSRPETLAVIPGKSFRTSESGALHVLSSSCSQAAASSPKLSPNDSPGRRGLQDSRQKPTTLRNKGLWRGQLTCEHVHWGPRSRRERKILGRP